MASVSVFQADHAFRSALQTTEPGFGGGVAAALEIIVNKPNTNDRVLNLIKGAGLLIGYLFCTV